MTMGCIFQVKAARTVILVAEGCSIDMPELQVSKIKACVHVVLHQQLTRYQKTWISDTCSHDKAVFSHPDR